VSLRAWGLELSRRRFSRDELREAVRRFDPAGIPGADETHIPEADRLVWRSPGAHAERVLALARDAVADGATHDCGEWLDGGACALCGWREPT